MSELIRPDEHKRSVERRLKVQQLLVDLYSYERKRPRQPHSQDPALQLLNAVAFSLWRAAFLPGGKRTAQKIKDDAIAFLNVLIRDNAIGYPQDREARRWTFGYYLNNAYLRLAYFDKLFQLPPRQSKRVAEFLRQHKVTSAYRAWDDAYEAASEAYHKLSKDKAKPSRGSKQSGR